MRLGGVGGARAGLRTYKRMPARMGPGAHSHANHPKAIALVKCSCALRLGRWAQKCLPRDTRMARSVGTKKEINRGQKIETDREKKMEH